MFTYDDLEQMKREKIDKTEKNLLVDITTIKAGKHIRNKEDLEHYIKVIKNPYLFKCGDVGVKLQFSEGDNKLSLQSLLTSFLIQLKQEHGITNIDF